MIRRLLPPLLVGVLSWSSNYMAMAAVSSSLHLRGTTVGNMMDYSAEGEGQSEPKCDLSASQRLKIQSEALKYLYRKKWGVVKKGVFGFMTNAGGGKVAGNPNTLYGMAVFNDTDHILNPLDYPPTEPFTIDPDKAPTPGGPRFGYTVGHNEAVVLMMCMPPPAVYVGITAYVTGRIMANESEPYNLYTHMPMTEISNPFNYLNLNTTSSTGSERKLKGEVRGFFNSVGLLVFASSSAVYEEVAQAYIKAGLNPQATNFYPLSVQSIRLHDRTKSSAFYDYPDLISIISRISYFADQEAGLQWAKHPHPVFYLRSPPDDSKYFLSVPQPPLVNDISGSSEEFLRPTIDQLIQAIIKDRTASGQVKLIRHEQLVPVPNDRSVQIQCLNNASFIAAVDPVMTTGSCGFGTRDCRYGTSAAMDLAFGDDLFFVVVGVKHEALGHSSYSSMMFTSQTGYEQADHTITFREMDGEGAPELYLPGVEDAQLLYSVTLARQCLPEDPYCINFTYDQFQSTDMVYWMERAYLQWSTGAAPNIDEYVMSHVLTFQGPTTTTTTTTTITTTREQADFEGVMKHVSQVA